LIPEEERKILRNYLDEDTSEDEYRRASKQFSAYKK
jgi:hypothetical protein